MFTSEHGDLDWGGSIWAVILLHKYKSVTRMSIRNTWMVLMRFLLNSMVSTYLLMKIRRCLREIGHTAGLSLYNFQMKWS